MQYLASCLLFVWLLLNLATHSSLRCRREPAGGPRGRTGKGTESLAPQARCFAALPGSPRVSECVREQWQAWEPAPDPPDRGLPRLAARGQRFSAASTTTACAFPRVLVPPHRVTEVPSEQLPQAHRLAIAALGGMLGTLEPGVQFAWRPWERPGIVNILGVPTPGASPGVQFVRDQQ